MTAMLHMRTLNTVDEVIDALGGGVAVRKLLGLKSAQALWAYRSRKSFPPKTFIIMNATLSERGCVAPPALWQMQEQGREDD
jgi:hypothetical protein